MFDSKPIVIHIPPGPYPRCTCGIGTLVPRVEPATIETERHMPFPAAPGMTEKYKSYMEGSVVLYWHCNQCGKRV